MSQTNSITEKRAKVFIDYCKKKNYQVESSADANNDWRLKISNFQERTILTIYHTGKIVQGGPNNSLKEEF